MWKTNFDIFNNIYVSSLDIVNSIYVRVFVRLLHLAATCRVLMFMLGVHNTDKLQAGKKTLTWIQKEVVQPRLCSS